MSENTRKIPDPHLAWQDDSGRKSMLYKDTDGGTIAVSEEKPLPVKIMNPQDIAGGNPTWVENNW